VPIRRSAVIQHSADPVSAAGTKSTKHLSNCTHTELVYSSGARAAGTALEGANVATGLANKTTPSGQPVTALNMEWPLYFCNVKGALGRNVWEDVPAKLGGNIRGEGVTVVHPDTGYSEHPELLKGGRLDVARSRNFLKADADALDPLIERFGQFPNHGSATAGVLMSEAGHPNDIAFGAPEFPTYSVLSDFYVTGIAPKAALIPCRVTDSVVLVGDSIPALTRAIYYAIELSETDLTVGVVSISLGCVVNRRILQGALAKAVRQAKSNGIVVCAAAGQVHEAVIKVFGPRYPGHDRNAICVAACDSTHAILTSGFYGSVVDITAPGVDIWRSLSERPAGGGSTVFSVQQSTGSSYSAALVAGACALWQAHHGRTSLITTYGSAFIFDLFRWALAETCDTRGGTWETSKHGMGVLDVEALLKKDLISKPELVTWIATH
jgi:subtilisin family serine protease